MLGTLPLVPAIAHVCPGSCGGRSWLLAVRGLARVQLRVNARRRRTQVLEPSPVTQMHVRRQSKTCQNFSDTVARRYLDENPLGDDAGAVITRALATHSTLTVRDTGGRLTAPGPNRTRRAVPQSTHAGKRVAY